MKKLLSILILVFPGFSGHAQQTPIYSQYMNNNYSINPAVAGSRKCAEFKMGYRNQWVGIDESPFTGIMSLTARLSPKKKQLVNAYHGVGGSVEYDDAGIFNNTSFLVSYAYHLEIRNDLFLSAGLGSGLNKYFVDVKKMGIGNTDPVYKESNINLAYPVINSGLWIYNQDFYAGISGKNLYRNKLSPEAGIASREQRHYFATAGYRMTSQSKYFSFIPSFCFRFVPMAMPAVDLNYSVDYRNRLTGGISYRYNDGFSFMLLISPNQKINVGYSYDVNTSRIRYKSGGTHEIMLTFRTCGLKDQKEGIELCPSYR